MIHPDHTFEAYVDRLASQNDAFRRAACLGLDPDPAQGGRLLVTDTVRAMGPAFLRTCLEAIGTFDDFPPDADPEGYRNCGSVEIEGRTVWFRIILSDAEKEGRSDTAGRPLDTFRTLHVLFAADWPYW